jgi:cold shock CspA family protein
MSNAISGYGFIRLNDEEKEIFVHASSIVRSINKPLVLMDGQKVSSLPTKLKVLCLFDIGT